jgi:hypothetical protein
MVRGIDDKGVSINHCERYCLAKNKWEQISNLNVESSNFSLTVFNK